MRSNKIEQNIWTFKIFKTNNVENKEQGKQNIYSLVKFFVVNVFIIVIFSLKFRAHSNGIGYCILI